MTNRDEGELKPFIRNSGSQLGPQVYVDQRWLSPPAVPETEENFVPAATGRKTKLAAFGLSPSIIKAGDPDYAKCLDQANKYRKVRQKELAQLHGHVSAGAGALLASSALALAASRFLYQNAAQDGDHATLKQAAQLAGEARQCELAAWELASKEGVLKRRQEASDAGMPWLLNETGGTKNKLGRKTNAQRQAAAMEVPDRPVLDSEPEDGPDE